MRLRKGRPIPGNRDRSQQPQKWCTRCGAEPPYVAFEWQGDRWSSWCRLCRKTAGIRYNATEARAESRRLYLSNGHAAAADRRYNATLRGKTRRRWHLDTPLGKITHLIGRERYRIKHDASPRVRASSRRRLRQYLAERRRIWAERERLRKRKRGAA